MTNDHFKSKILYIVKNLFMYQVMQSLPPANEVWDRVMFYTYQSLCSQGGGVVMGVWCGEGEGVVKTGVW